MRYIIKSISSDGCSMAGITILEKLGHMDGQSICEAIKGLIAQGQRNQEIDLIKLTFCDSITLGICVMRHATIRRHAGTAQFTIPPNSQVAQVFHGSQLLLFR